MEGGASPVAVARNLVDLDHALRSVVQKRGCVQCNSSSQLQCPKCPTGQVCQYTIPVDCTQCAQTICMPDDSSPSPNNSNGNGGGSGPSAAPIIGGVVGGITVIAILTFLVWRCLIRPKRSRIPQSMYEPTAKTTRDVEKDNASRITHRSSTYTVHSIASTVLTRASNIIQIAYIPGVTNRATPTSPTVLVPPVPPIPMHHSGANRDSNHQDDEHFFVPGNLRDSTYSGISDFSDRTSYAPRSSIASTIYGKQAQVQTPAQTGMRAKPTVVSVKSVGSSGASLPPVPAIDFERFGGGRPKSGASALSVSSTSLNNADTATQARAQVVKLGGGGGPKKIDVGSKPEGSGLSTPPGPVSSPGLSVQGQTRAANVMGGDSSPRDQGPFSDPPSTQKPACGSTLGAVIEDEDEEHGDDGAARRPRSSERGRSPFGDEHATKE